MVTLAPNQMWTRHPKDGMPIGQIIVVETDVKETTWRYTAIQDRHTCSTSHLVNLLVREGWELAPFKVSADFNSNPIMHFVMSN